MMFESHPPHPTVTAAAEWLFEEYRRQTGSHEPDRDLIAHINAEIERRKMGGTRDDAVFFDETHGRVAADE